WTRIGIVRSGRAGGEAPHDVGDAKAIDEAVGLFEHAVPVGAEAGFNLEKFEQRGEGKSEAAPEAGGDRGPENLTLAAAVEKTQQRNDNILEGPTHEERDDGRKKLVQARA